MQKSHPPKDRLGKLAQLFSSSAYKLSNLRPVAAFSTFSKSGLEELCNKQLLLFIAMIKQRFLGMIGIVLCFVAESEVRA